MIEKLTLQDIIDRIDQVRERGPRLFGYRIVKDEELAVQSLISALHSRNRSVTHAPCWNSVTHWWPMQDDRAAA